MAEGRYPGDRALDVQRPIARRDFLNGAVAAATGTSLAALIPAGPAKVSAAAQGQQGYYPPHSPGCAAVIPDRLRPRTDYVTAL
jgi:hypothetical protein